MDKLDLAILQEMTSPESMLFSGLNPRLSPEKISRRVGLDPSSIRARMRGWKDSGFLVDWTILPNPSLLGLRHMVGYVEAPTLANRGDVLQAISETDGTVCSFEHVQGHIGIGFFADSRQTMERRLRMLTRLPGVESSQPYGVMELSDAPRRLNDTEWRVLAAMRADPGAPMSAIAERAGVSGNTASARYKAMVQAGALWHVPDLDFTRFAGGALVRVFATLDSSTTCQKAFAALADAGHIGFFFRDVERPDGEPGSVAHAMFRLRTIAMVEDLEAAALEVKGVSSVRILMPKAFRSHAEWVDERLSVAGEKPEA